MWTYESHWNRHESFEMDMEAHLLNGGSFVRWFALFFLQFACACSWVVVSLSLSYSRSSLDFPVQFRWHFTHYSYELILNVNLRCCCGGHFGKLDEIESFRSRNEILMMTTVRTGNGENWEIIFSPKIKLNSLCVYNNDKQLSSHSWRFSQRSRCGTLNPTDYGYAVLFFRDVHCRLNRRRMSKSKLIELN